MFLEKFDSPKKLKTMSTQELADLCSEIRETLVDSVMKTGGHLASNLGVVELTIAMHIAFDCPKDKFIFDVGHQSYVHKLLTGRYEKFDTLRQLDGLSGFPNPKESEYDAFMAGHASTSVSAALGMARARDLKGEDYDVIALIGDGALGGGEAFEALNDAGNSGTKLIVILNDNEMSIDKNVGGLSRHLTKLRTSKRYIDTKADVTNFLEKFGKLGIGVKKTISKAKEKIKYSAITGVVFEELGFTYLGLVDGHNLDELIYVLKRAKNLNGPVIIHTLTKKGYGYSEAEKQPEAYHGVNSTLGKKSTNKSYSNAAGEILEGIMEDNSDVCVITAAMASGCGIKNIEEKYPDRFFDVGIAEQHATTMAAGLAVGGAVPVFCVYSTFLQRAYDQIIHDVCLQNLHVVFLIDRAGVVGNDGPTHQGVFDLSFLTHIPNMTVMAPSDYSEFQQMLDFAVNKHTSPVAIRYPRGDIEIKDSKPFEYKKADVVRDGNDVVLFSAGNMLQLSINVADILDEKGLSCAVVNLRTLKPFDKETVSQYTKKCRLSVTLEDNCVNGGIGAYISQNMRCADMMHFGWPDEFVPHGKISMLMERYGLSKEKIADKILGELDRG